MAEREPNSEAGSEQSLGAFFSDLGFEDGDIWMWDVGVGRDRSFTLQELDFAIRDSGTKKRRIFGYNDEHVRQPIKLHGRDEVEYRLSMVNWENEQYNVEIVVLPKGEFPIRSEYSVPLLRHRIRDVLNESQRVRSQFIFEMTQPLPESLF